jgi:GNAT superfamily N-acetyltransferase
VSVERLHPDEWEALRSIYESEFRSAMPDPTAAILVDREAGRLNGFAALESVIWIPELYVAPERRGGRSAVNLLRYIEQKVKGRTVLCTPDSERMAQMCEKFQMRRIAGTIYRKAVA